MMDRRTIFRYIRWLVISAALGAAIGIGVGLYNDTLKSSLILGAGIGLILGWVLAAQHHS